jgi:hypothetical protein
MLAAWERHRRLSMRKVYRRTPTTVSMHWAIVGLVSGVEVVVVITVMRCIHAYLYYSDRRFNSTTYGRHYQGHVTRLSWLGSARQSVMQANPHPSFIALDSEGLILCRA